MRRWAQLAILLLASSGAAELWAQPDEPPADDASAPPAEDEEQGGGDAAEGGGGGGFDDVDGMDLGDWADDDDDQEGEGGAPPAFVEEGDEDTDRLSREERRRRSRQAALEAIEARPPLPDVDGPEAPPWERRLEIGAHFAMVERPFADAAVPGTGIGYKPAPGFGVQLRWNIVSWLRLHAYFHDAHHAIDLPPGGLLSAAADSIPADAAVDPGKAQTFSFGVALAPTWNITDRFRGWVSAGIGWGLFDFTGVTVTLPGSEAVVAPPRSGAFLEFPLGLGVAFDVIERWLVVDVQALAAPATSQSGDAHRDGEIQADGDQLSVGPFPAAEVSFVQTIGLSLIL